MGVSFTPYMPLRGLVVKIRYLPSGQWISGYRMRRQLRILEPVFYGQVLDGVRW